MALRSDGLGAERRDRRSSSSATRGPFFSLGLVVLLIMVGLIASQGWFLVEIPLGDSEWAFDNTGLRDLSDEGLDGAGVRLRGGHRDRCYALGP